MTKFSRREFLRLLAASTGALTLNQILAACGLEELTPLPTASPTRLPSATNTQPPPTAQPTETTEPDPTATATEQPPQPTDTPQGKPDLVVARNSDPETLTRRALAAIGGMQRFVPKGSDVIIKPNICVSFLKYEYAATTNPWVVAGLVKLALEAGARRVRVMDYPFGGGPEEAYTRSGIQEQVVAAGGEMEIMTRLKFVKTDIPQGLDLHKCEIYDEVLNADVVIDVPVAKHHSLAKLTLGMKNLLGVIRDRPAIHRNMGQRLADLTSRVQPALTVVDADRILKAHAPSGGTLDDVVQQDTLNVSPDIVAPDSYAAT